MNPIIIVFLIMFFIFTSLIIFVPIHVVVNVGYEEKFYGIFSLILLWGLLKSEYFHKEKKILFYIDSMKIYKLVIKEKKKNKVKKLRKRRPKNIRNILSINFAFVSKVMLRIFRSISPQGKIQATIGLGGPAETGFLTGILNYFMFFSPLSITALPDFKEEKLILNGWFSFRILIASLLIIMTDFVLSKKGRAILRNL